MTNNVDRAANIIAEAFRSLLHASADGIGRDLARKLDDNGLISGVDLREEWGVQYQEVAGPTVFTHETWRTPYGGPFTRDTANTFAEECISAGYTNVCIIRRRVTDTEKMT